MKANIEYNYVLSPQKVLDIDEVGEVAIEASVDSRFYYLIITTSLGYSKVLQCGPLIPDMPTEIDKTDYSYSKISYKESKLINILSKFLVDKQKATIISKDEALSRIPNIVDFMCNGE